MSRMIYVKYETKDPMAVFDHFKIKPNNLSEDGTPIQGEGTLNADKNLEQ